MPEYHRGRARDRDYYDDDSDDYYTEPEPEPERRHRPASKPQHRSLSRRAKDKLEHAMEKLGLADSDYSNTLVHRRHRSPTPGPAISSGAIGRRRRSSSSSSYGRHHGHQGHHRFEDYNGDGHEHRHRNHSHVGSHRSDGHHNHHHHHHHHRRHHHREGDDSHDRRSSHYRRGRSQSHIDWDRSFKSAVDAAALEAFRLRKEPGGWTSPRKTSRIATAAVSAAAIGAALDDKKPSKEKRGELATIGSAVGGLVVNRLVNGPRKELRRPS